MAKSDQGHFIRDCIARSLLTLPWATIDPTQRATAAQHTTKIHALRELIPQLGERDAKDRDGDGSPELGFVLKRLQQVIMNEASIHEDCDNWIKADVLRKFGEGVVNYYMALGMRRPIG